MWRKALLLSMFLGLACAAGGPPRRADGIILVTFDTARADRIGCYGNDLASTPTLDRLAAGGILFARCYSEVPTTLASHTTIMSSLYPRTHGVPRNGFGVPASVSTLAEIFAGKGFRTAAFVGSFPLSHTFGLNRGFEEYDDETEQGPAGGELERPAGAVVERARAWLEGVGDEPFFLWVHLFDPHWPYGPPAPFGSIRRPPPTRFDPTELADVMAIRFRREPFEESDQAAFLAAYDGEIAYADRCLGGLLDALPAGRGGRLLVAVTGDHGEGFGEHHYYFDHGDFLWESGIHVPLILYGPGFLPAGRVVDGAVRLLDIAPTLLEAAGIRPLDDFEGASLLPAADGPIPSRLVFSEASKPWNVEVRGEYQNKYKAKSVVDGRWKLIVTPYRDRKELFDLVEDPEEEADIIAREPEVAARLETALVEWIREKDPGFREDDLTIDEDVREKLRSLGYSR